MSKCNSWTVGLIGLMTATAPISAVAQGDKFGSDPEQCKMQVSLYREYFKQKNYDDAISGWRWAFIHCPASTKNILINGPELMQHFIDKHKDNAALRKGYADTLLLVYDKRAELFPEDRAWALGRKGIDLLQLRPEEPDAAYKALLEAFRLAKSDMEANAMAMLYQAGMRLLTEGKIKVEEMFDLYDEISSANSVNLKKGEEDKSYKYYRQAQDVLDQNFERIAQEDQYIDLMKPKVAAAPQDAALLEKVSTMMVRRRWTGNPFYLEVSEKLYKISPTATAAYNLFEGYHKASNQKEALRYLEESIKLETDNMEKADRLLKYGQMLGAQNQYAAARSKAQEAAALRPSWGEPYLYIGSLYLSTSASCGSDACDRAYGYWAAEDMFNKAKSVDSSVSSDANVRIAQARKYYPTAKDCFFIGVQDGQSVTVGGWIGVETKARFAAN